MLRDARIHEHQVSVQDLQVRINPKSLWRNPCLRAIHIMEILVEKIIVRI